MKKALLLLALIALGFTQGVSQSIFSPEVVLNTSGVSDRATRDLGELETRLSDMLLNYHPAIPLKHLPKNPIRIFLLLNIKSGDGTAFVGDLEMGLYRPIYGQEKESLIFISSIRDLNFRFRRELNPGFLGQSLPNEVLLSTVYTLSTLGLFYYYDSFAILGGSPILDYLDERMGDYRQIISSEMQGFGLSDPSKDIERQVTELKSPQGDRFRELWYLYHRKGLDAEDSAQYYQTLYATLTGLNSLRDENSTLSFYQFFSDTKRGEIRSYMDSVPSKPQEGIHNLLEELFPNILNRL